MLKRYGAGALTVLALTATQSSAEARPYADPAWRDVPAWSTVVPAQGARAIPIAVCPFGISDLAGYRGARRLDARLSFAYESAAIRNDSRQAIRAYVWCG